MKGRATSVLVLTMTVGKAKVYHSCLDRQLASTDSIDLNIDRRCVDIEERQVSFIVRKIGIVQEFVLNDVLFACHYC